MLMLCLVCAVAGPVMPGAGDVSTMDPTMAYGAAPNMIVFAPDGGAGLGQDSLWQSPQAGLPPCGGRAILGSTDHLVQD